MPIKLDILPSSQSLHSSGQISRAPFAKILISAALVSMSLGTAHAQSDAQRIADLERKLQKAMNVIEKLSDKVERMETGNTNPVAVAPKSTETLSSGDTTTISVKPADLPKTVAEQNNRIETIQQQVTQLSTAASNRIIPFDWLHGFADVGGGYGSSGHPAGFGVGSLDLYMTPKLGGQVRSLAELVFEYDRFGSLGTDLERVQIGYAFNDKVNLWLGRFHTPYGYWQTAYHHGQQIQPSLLRPRFIDFEDKGGMLPAHTTGAWLTGGFQGDGGKLVYDLYTGNSGKIIKNDTGNILDPNVAGFSNSSLSAGGKLGYNFTNGSLEGLNVGVHGLHSQIRITPSLTDSPIGQVELNMAGGYLYYNNYDWEVISEIYGFMNRDLQAPPGSQNMGTHNSWAGFVHVGHQFDQWMPYARLEKADTDKNDIYFKTLTYGYAYSREALGLRYDVNPQSALKLEMNYTQPDINPDNQLKNFWESRMQYAIRF